MDGSAGSGGNLRSIVARILGLSAVTFVFLLWLLFFRGGPEPDSDALAFLPAANAALNGLATTCILCGFAAIKSGRPRVHMTLMISALCLSVVFLASYITYHTVHGNTEFLTEGRILYLYYGVLISHVSCTVFALPLIMFAVFFAATKRFELHKRVTKYAFPLWLYVSVTGVAIYFLLNANS